MPQRSLANIGVQPTFQQITQQTMYYNYTQMDSSKNNNQTTKSTHEA